MLLFLQAHALAQEVKGRILDASTKEVIPFAHIVLINTHKGTVANQNGEFNFWGCLYKIDKEKHFAIQNP